MFRRRIAMYTYACRIDCVPHVQRQKSKLWVVSGRWWPARSIGWVISFPLKREPKSHKCVVYWLPPRAAERFSEIVQILHRWCCCCRRRCRLLPASSSPRLHASAHPVPFSPLHPILAGIPQRGSASHPHTSSNSRAHTRPTRLIAVVLMRSLKIKLFIFSLAFFPFHAVVRFHRSYISY